MLFLETSSTKMNESGTTLDDERKKKFLRSVRRKYLIPRDHHYGGLHLPLQVVLKPSRIKKKKCHQRHLEGAFVTNKGICKKNSNGRQV